MEKLDTFDFSRRPSRSRYATAVNALLNGTTAVRLKRGEDFPEDLNIESVQGSIAGLLRKEGKHARTYRESNDSLVVGLQSAPAQKRRGRERISAPA